MKQRVRKQKIDKKEGEDYSLLCIDKC